jgi:hypothetical protein
MSLQVLDIAFQQGTAMVVAGIVHRVVLTPMVKDGNVSLSYFYELARTFWKILNPRHEHSCVKVARHDLCLSQVLPYLSFFLGFPFG